MSIIEFKPSVTEPEAKPLFDRAPYDPKQCDHKGATFYVDSLKDRVVCSICNQPVEAIYVLKRLCDSEFAKARRDNADAYHRQYAEEQAEKQAAKTRKAAYATLFRFGVTPEMYAEEYRRKQLLNELEMKQDYSRALPFQEKAQ